MTTADRDGLSAVQIARINRLQLARYRRPQKRNRTGSVPLAGLLFGIWLTVCFALVLIQNSWSPGTELYTRLSANLDEQPPSITVYADGR